MAEEPVINISWSWFFCIGVNSTPLNEVPLYTILTLTVHYNASFLHFICWTSTNVDSFMPVTQSWYGKEVDIFLKVGLLGTKNAMFRVPLFPTLFRDSFCGTYLFWEVNVLFLASLKISLHGNCKMKKYWFELLFIKSHYQQHICCLPMFNRNTRFHWLEQWDFLVAIGSRYAAFRIRACSVSSQSMWIE